MNFLTNVLSKAGIITVTEIQETTTTKDHGKPVTVAGAPNVSVASTVVVPPAQAVQTGMTQEQMQKFEEHFNKLFNDANLPGPDYHEFLTMVDSFEADGIPENVAFKTVFKALSAQGMTKDYLLSSAAQYLDVIGRDKENFTKTVEAKINDQVGGRIQKNTDLQQAIKEKQELIESLQRDIVQAQESIKANDAEIANVQQTIGANTQAYNIACEALKNKIEEDVKKIQVIL